LEKAQQGGFMDIGLFRNQFLGNERNPFSSSSAQEAQLRSSMEQGGFEEILRRMESSSTQGNSATGQTEGGPRAAGLTPVDKSSQLYELCMELETILIKNLIRSMRNTVEKTNLIDTGFAGEVYEDMLYDEYAKTYARNANLGFAEMAYRDLTRGQVKA
jgi:flagellar protein FlgJ